MQTRRVLLPGMDGTGALFARYLAVDAAEATVVTWPVDEPLGYDALAGRVALPVDAPYVLVAESYSGPVAIRLAAARPPGLVGVVLVATFATNPTPIPAWPVPALLFGVAPPRRVLAALLTGGDLGLADEVRRALATVAPTVLARRVAEVLRVDVTREVSAISVPVLVVRGTRDRLVPAASAERLLRACRRGRIVDIDAPHLVLQAAPTAARQAIDDWVRTG